jgi:hypothetical protein
MPDRTRSRSRSRSNSARAAISEAMSFPCALAQIGVIGPMKEKHPIEMFH